MKPRVYIETSVISRLTARPPRDIIQAGHQQSTIAWWESRDRFELFVSDVVFDEAARGDPEAAIARRNAIAELRVLPITDAATSLAAALISSGDLPERALVDALHIAIASVARMNFLLTWNCRHIANPWTRPRVEARLRSLGYLPPSICTPDELLNDVEEVRK